MGRPVNIYFSAEMLAAIDREVESQSTTFCKPSRSDIVRRLVEEGLAARERKPRRAAR